MNKAIIRGRLTKDVASNANGAMAVSRFTVALDRGKDKEGKDKGADFVSCVAFGKTAETIAKYLSKGSDILIEGHIQTGSYENKKGDKVYTTDIIVDRFEFVGSKKNAEAKTSAEDGIPEGFEPIDDDEFESDLPF